MNTRQQQILTVSQLNHQAQLALEAMGVVWIEGEISNHVQASSGHHYFSLKDDKSQVSAALFRFQARRVRFPLRDGLEVLVRAKVSLYSPRGSYQIIVEHMELAGEGRLRQQFEALKAKLAAEGLFNEESKRPLPRYPKHIGLITSPSGAALQDMLRILSRHGAHIPVKLYPALVQGKEAPASLRAALAQAVQEAQCDVLVIGRGGGSLEDLWAFNDEALTRDVAHCPIPIISAVGHEIDFCLTDFAADWRAPTPTAAAEELARASAQLPQQLQHYEQRLKAAIKRHLSRLTEQQHYLARRLRHPAATLRQHEQQLDELHRRLEQHMFHHLERLKQRQQFTLARLPNAARQQLNAAQLTINGLAKRFAAHSPYRQLQQHRQRLHRAQHALAGPLRQQINHHGLRLHWIEQQLPLAMQHSHQQTAQRLAHMASRLENSSPLKVLARGYGLTLHQGKHVRSVEQIQVGDTIEQRLSDGHFTAEVTAIEKKTS